MLQRLKLGAGDREQAHNCFRGKMKRVIIQESDEEISTEGGLL